MTTWLYDGTFDGFLSAVFDLYWQRTADVRIRKELVYIPSMREQAIFMPTVTANAERVWIGLGKRLSPRVMQDLFACYLAEQDGEEDNMVAFIRYVFATGQALEPDAQHPGLLRVKELAAKAWQEKQALEEQLRFEIAIEEEPLYYAMVEQAYNVLPLTVAYFKQRYTAQRWFIYDLGRRYGIFYAHGRADATVLLFEAAQRATHDIAAVWTPDEGMYRRLWKAAHGQGSSMPRGGSRQLQLRYVSRGYEKYVQSW